MAAINLGGKWLGYGSWRWQGKTTMLCPRVEGGYRGGREREEKWHLVTSPCLSHTVQSWPVPFISLLSYLCQSLLSSFFSDSFSRFTCWGCQIHFCVLFLLPSPPSTLPGYLLALLWGSHSARSYSNIVLFQSLFLSTSLLPMLISALLAWPNRDQRTVHMRLYHQLYKCMTWPPWRGRGKRE